MPEAAIVLGSGSGSGGNVHLSSVVEAAKDSNLAKMSSASPIIHGKKEHSRPSAPWRSLSSVLLWGSIICLLLVLTVSVSAAASDEDADEIIEVSCICNLTFFKSCPKSCKKGGKRRFMPVDHDDEDPDHPQSADISPDFNSKTDEISDFQWPKGEALKKLRKVKPNANKVKVVSSTQKIPYVPEDTEKIERTRKVYVTDKSIQNRLEKQSLPGIRLRIPIVINEDTTRGLLPPPKPFFKLRKYVTYEDRKEMQMVPVTKTIIKPSDMASSRIIDQGRPNSDGDQNQLAIDNIF